MCLYLLPNDDRDEGRCLMTVVRRIVVVGHGVKIKQIETDTESTQVVLPDRDLDDRNCSMTVVR